MHFVIVKITVHRFGFITFCYMYCSLQLLIQSCGLGFDSMDFSVVTGAAVHSLLFAFLVSMFTFSHVHEVVASFFASLSACSYSLVPTVGRP